MIWVVAIVIAYVVFKDKLPAGVSSAASAASDMVGSGANAIYNGQTYTQGLSPAASMGSGLDRSGSPMAAPNTTPGNVPIKPPAFAGTGIQSVIATAHGIFQAPLAPSTRVGSVNPGLFNTRPSSFTGVIR